MTTNATLPATLNASLIPPTSDGGVRRASGLLALLKALGPMRILAMGAVALATLGFFTFLIFKVTEPDYTILFGDLEPAAAGQIVDQLAGMAVPNRLSADGRTILVPAPMVTRLRMELAQNGLPAAGPAGYELLDNSNAFTSTDLLTNLNLRRALEGELARTIASLSGVASARVHLVQPRRELFERDQQHPSASVLVKLRGNGLDPRQVQGIRQLVASATPGLSPERVTIVDDRGNLLARASEGDGNEVDQDELESQRLAYEGRLRQKVLNLLEPSIGLNRVEVEIHADMDFDDETTTSESFDPDRAVPRSTQSTEEKNERSESEPQAATTVSGNLPTEQAPPEPHTGSTEKTARTEETTNFEISKTVVSHVRRGAQIKRLTIAVQVADAQLPGADGQMSSQPRDATELAQLAALVKTATGFNEQRGDVVEIVSRKFAAADAGQADEAQGSLLSRIDIDKLVNYALIGGLAFLLIFFGLRPLAKEVAKAGRPALTLPVAGGQPQIDTLLEEPPLLTGPAADMPTPITLTEIATAPDAGTDPAGTGSEMIELPQVAGAIRGELVRDANGLIQERPEETLRVLRGWLSTGS